MSKKLMFLFLVAFIVFISASAYAVVVLDCNNGGRYEDMGDGTVQDCRTGLIWLKNANCTDTSNGIANPTGSLTFQNALTWVAGLGQGRCGLNDISYPGDWRLPTKTEWMAMVAYAKKMGYSMPALTNSAGSAKWTNSDDAFNNVLGGYYWSSTTYFPIMSAVWVLYMYDGSWGGNDKTIDVLVWPVRGGQSGEFGNVIIQ